MKQCQLLENEKNKVKRIIKIFTLCTIIIFFIIIFLILKLYQFDFSILNNINWDAIGAVGTILTLIGAVIISKKELAQNTKNQIMATELEKFKENLNNEINKYMEFSNELFKCTININTNRADIISTDDLNLAIIIIYRYRLFINCIIQNIIYYYGNYSTENPIFINFIAELSRINSIINERVNYFTDLAKKMNNLNSEYLKIFLKQAKKNLGTNGSNKIYIRAKDLVDNYYTERQKLTISSDDLVKLKQMALNVIEEKKQFIEKNLNKIYKF